MATTSQPPSPSDLPPVPLSPTYSYASTALPIPSSFNLPLPPPPRSPHAVLNKADLEASQVAYADVLSTAKAYRLALAALSTSASQFGSALEACARLKEARSESMLPSGMDSMTNSFSAKGGVCTADNLLTASGLHQLIANHQQILSETVYRSFEVPLLHELDQWQRRMEEEEVAYQREAKAMSKEIRKMEKDGIKLHKQRKRDVGLFREHLVQLTSKLDSLTGLSGGHSRGLLRDCQEMSKGIVECSAGLVRAEIEIFEALARKGWTGGGLDELFEKGQDLFASDLHGGAGDAHPNQGAKIFSILPQNRSILAAGDTGDGPARLTNNHSRSDSLLVDGMPYQSLAGAVSGPRDSDMMSMFSDRDIPSSGILNKSRGVRPFSPTPGERVKDPLEDIEPISAFYTPKSRQTMVEEQGEEQDDGLESTSAKTIVPIGRVGDDEAIEGQGMEPVESLEPEQSLESKESLEPEERSENENVVRRGIERRWSVTDDGVASD